MKAEINTATEKKTRLLFWFLFAVAVAIWLSVMYVRKDTHGSADEKTHIEQIQYFLKGKYQLVPYLTNIPTYHIIIAFFTDGFFHDKTRAEMHAISFPLALLAIWAFYLLAQKISPQDRYLRTAQFIFLPISFYYFPFIYVDIFSLFLVLLALYLALLRHYKWSAFFAFFSVAVRQVNIIWAIFIFVYSYVEENDFLFSRERILKHFKNCWSYFLVFVAFGAFVWINGGIALGDKENQQAGFYLGNVYFSFFLLAVLFLPILISSLKKITFASFEKTHIKTILVGLSVALLFVFLRPSLHPYNVNGNLKVPFLRNILLENFYQQYFYIYAIAVFLGVISILFLKLEKKHWLVLLFALYSIIPSLLVEQRYMIIPITLILLFRKHIFKKAEWFLVYYFLLIDIVLFFLFFKLSLFF